MSVFAQMQASTSHRPSCTALSFTAVHIMHFVAVHYALCCHVHFAAMCTSLPCALCCVVHFAVMYTLLQCNSCGVQMIEETGGYFQMQYRGGAN